MPPHKSPPIFPRAPITFVQSGTMKVSYGQCKELVRDLWRVPGVVWHWEKAMLVGEDKGNPFTLRFPEAFPPPPLILPASRYDGHPRLAVTLGEYAAALPDAPPPFLLILIQAGHAGIGYFEGGEVLHHKVVKKYMVRGNGKSQINYLGSRGKSKAGSRVRLANTVRFFEDINEKLLEWNCSAKASHIFVSCPVKIQPLWFGSEPEPPFTKQDSRLRKVPLDVDRPDLEELLHVAKALCSGNWEGNPNLLAGFSELSGLKSPSLDPEQENDLP